MADARTVSEDAATIQIGQEVEARMQSLPGQEFAGRVTFVDPRVDPKKRTVGVRVAIPNDEGLLRVGDYAKATIQILPTGEAEALVVPRSAVLMAGDDSVLYVETEPGRFEIRKVEIECLHSRLFA